MPELPADEKKVARSVDAEVNPREAHHRDVLMHVGDNEAEREVPHEEFALGPGCTGCSVGPTAIAGLRKTRGGLQRGGVSFSA